MEASSMQSSTVRPPHAIGNDSQVLAPPASTPEIERNFATAQATAAAVSASSPTAARSLEDLFHQWIAAGLLPPDRWMLETEFEGPARQRRKMANYEQFYSDFHVHPLPLEVALSVYVKNPRASLSVPLLKLRPGQTIMNSIHEFVSELESGEHQSSLLEGTDPQSPLSPSAPAMFKRSPSDEDININALNIVPVIAMEALREAIDTETARSLDETVEELNSDDLNEDESDIDSAEPQGNDLPSASPALVTSVSLPTLITNQDEVQPAVVSVEKTIVSTPTVSPAAASITTDKSNGPAKSSGVFGKLFGKIMKDSPSPPSTSASSSTQSSPKSTSSTSSAVSTSNSASASVINAPAASSSGSPAASSSSSSTQLPSLSTSNSFNNGTSSKWTGNLSNKLAQVLSPTSTKPVMTRTQSTAEVDEEDDESVDECQRFFHLLAAGDEFLPRSLFACWRISGLEKHPAVLLLATHRCYIINDFTLDADGKLMAVSEHESLAGPTSSFQVTLRVRPPSAGAWEDHDPEAPVPVPRLANGNVDRSALDVVLHVSKVKRNSAEAQTLGELNSYEMKRRAEESFSSSFQNHLKLRYLDLTAIHRRRYALGPLGLELFSSTGHTPLLAFATHVDRERVYTLLVQQCTVMSKLQAVQFESSAKRMPELDPRDLPLPAALQTDEQQRSRMRAASERWQQGLLSNFDYLCFLNTCAGRSSSDLTQYPVFPWILADYQSNKLDLNEARTFRDLSKPMGALDPQRAKLFQDRYDSWDDGSGSASSSSTSSSSSNSDSNDNNASVGHRFHYATHYSSPASVLYSLIRVQPFTKTALQLQGGRFDHADRLFHDVARSYASASSTGGLTDVTELIPEWFTLPDMFVNTDRFDFGEKQRGGYVDHVKLPPWAKNDPRLFVRLHRDALESPHVSANLHHWIDLIFGYKQRGKHAVKAINVFHFLTYEGVINLDKITDPLTRAATIDQMKLFGQTPHQLFKRAHPTRRVVSTASLEMSIPKHSHLLHKAQQQPNLRAIPSLPNKPSRICSLFYLPTSERLIALDGYKAFIPHHWSKFISYQHVDSSLRVRHMPLANKRNSSHTFSGFGFSASSSASKSADASVLSCIIPHGGDAIVCLNVTDDARYVITGSTNHAVAIHQPHPIYEFAVLSLVHSYSAHAAPVTAVASNAAWSMLISGAADGSVILFDLEHMKIKRHLPLHPGAITAIACHVFTGDFVTAAGNALFVWNVNGELVAEKTAGSNDADTIDAVAFTQGNTSDYCIITGGRDSVVRIRSVEKPIIVEEVATTAQKSDEQKAGIDESEEKATKPFKPRPDYESALLAAPKHGNTFVHGWPLLTLQLKATLDLEGAAVTCIHCSPTEVSRLWIGDANGAVTLFCLSKDEHWQKDDDNQSCALCASKFTPINRRHHCRKCGQVICNKCSSRRMPLPSMGHMEAVRVCNSCWQPSVTHMMTKDGKLIKII